MEEATWIRQWTRHNDPRYAVKYDGDKLTANDGDVCISFITYEYLKNKPTPYCMDVGADECWWSIFCCEHFPNTRVDAFEPKPCGTEWKTYLQQRYPSITLHNCAVSDHVGTIPFIEQGAESHSRIASSKSVPCITLKPFIEKAGFVDLIKIDTEGHELHIMKDILPFHSQIGAIIFEFSIYWYDESKREALSKSKNLFVAYKDKYPFVYAISRRGIPRLVPIQTPELTSFFLYCFEHRLQYDVLFSKTPFHLSVKFPQNISPLEDNI